MSSKKGGKKLGYCKDSSLRDVTLADYANASVSSAKGRLRKSKTYNIVKEVEQLNIEDKAWDEKLDEFEGNFDFVKEENEDGEEVYVMKKVEKVPKSGKKTVTCDGTQKDESGNSYPLDVWYLIAGHIRPEDVAIFGAICKDARSVVNSPSFWKSLYNKHYINLPTLPERLKPDCMMRLHGLKACVVRSLFYTYAPFASRAERVSMSTAYNLQSRQCVSIWQESHSNKWRLNIKLRRKDYLSSQSPREKPDLLEVLSDIYANPDDGCSILQVVSVERTTPACGETFLAVMGLTLHSVNIKMDIMLTYMTVQLVFGSGRFCNGKLDTVGTITISIKTVLQVNVLDWWHPQYPHSAYTISCQDDS